MLEAIVELFLDVILQVFFEVVVESLWPRYRRAWKPGRGTQALTLAFLGAVAGLIGVCLFPKPLLPRSPVTGLSLIVAPVAAGLAMHYFGLWRARRNKQPTFLATFWGGALFACAMSSVRLLLITGWL